MRFPCWLTILHGNGFAQEAITEALKLGESAMFFRKGVERKRSCQNVLLMPFGHGKVRDDNWKARTQTRKGKGEDDSSRRAVYKGRTDHVQVKLAELGVI
jgi:hypothetical protein